MRHATKKPIKQSQFNIHLLDKYMLNTRLMEDISKSGYVDTTFLRKQRTNMEKKDNAVIAKLLLPPPSSIAKEAPSNPLFVPYEQDTLFWSFYILKHGMEAYQNMHQRNIVVEKALKIEYIEKLRANKGILKAHKCGPLAHIENALLNERSIDLKTLEALCIIESVSCIFVFDKCYYEINIGEDELVDTEISMIVKKPHPEKYGYVEVCDVSTTRNTLHKVDNVSKPLKAMSSYKLDELVELCKKLNISIIGTVRKKNLYEELVKTLCV